MYNKTYVFIGLCTEPTITVRRSLRTTCIFIATTSKRTITTTPVRPFNGLQDNLGQPVQER